MKPMKKQSLGLIETWGYVPAIEAADAGTKAADVTLLGYERARTGLITVKFVGDVAAVKAAVTAGSAAAEKVGKVVAVHVIPRPDRQLRIGPPDGPQSPERKADKPMPPAPPAEEKKEGAAPEPEMPPEEKKVRDRAKPAAAPREKKAKDKAKPAAAPREKKAVGKAAPDAPPRKEPKRSRARPSGKKGKTK